jgi:hypothetical protein
MYYSTTTHFDYTVTSSKLSLTLLYATTVQVISVDFIGRVKANDFVRIDGFDVDTIIGTFRSHELIEHDK